MSEKPQPFPSAAQTERMEMKIYLAGPLFSTAERITNRELAALITQQLPGTEIILPQDFKHHNEYASRRWFKEVYVQCIAGIINADMLVAILDGPCSDDGTCFEVGYAIAKGKPVIGVRTDFRESQERGMNLMLSQGCTEIVHRPSFDEDSVSLARDIARKIKKLQKFNAETMRF